MSHEKTETWEQREAATIAELRIAVQHFRKFCIVTAGVEFLGAGATMTDGMLMGGVEKKMKEIQHGFDMAAKGRDKAQTDLVDWQRWANQTIADAGHELTAVEASNWDASRMAYIQGMVANQANLTPYGKALADATGSLDTWRNWAVEMVGKHKDDTALMEAVQKNWETAETRDSELLYWREWASELVGNTQNDQKSSKLRDLIEARLASSESSETAISKQLDQWQTWAHQMGKWEMGTPTDEEMRQRIASGGAFNLPIPLPDGHELVMFSEWQSGDYWLAPQTMGGYVWVSIEPAGEKNFLKEGKDYRTKPIIIARPIAKKPTKQDLSNAYAKAFHDIETAYVHDAEFPAKLEAYNAAAKALREWESA